MKKIRKNWLLKIVELYDGYYRGGTGRGEIDDELADFLVVAINKQFTVKQAENWWKKWMAADYKKHPYAY